MRYLKIIGHVVLMIALPLSILLLGLNVSLRFSETYVYHFNDSQVTSGLGISTTGSELADYVCGYLNSFSKEPFQVYEENGKFLDPLFEDEESAVMLQARRILGISLLACILLLALSVLAYIWLYRNCKREERLIGGYVAVGLSAVAALTGFFLVRSDAFCVRMYNLLIGVDLGEDSLLRHLLGTPLNHAVAIFVLAVCIAAIGISLYIHSHFTKAQRIFY